MSPSSPCPRRASAGAEEFLALLSELKRLRVNLDMISRNYLGSGSAAVSFTLSGSDLARAEKAIAACPGAVTVRGACKLTAEGAGMQHKSGVAADVLSLLAGTGACIYFGDQDLLLHRRRLRAKSHGRAESVLRNKVGEFTDKYFHKKIKTCANRGSLFLKNIQNFFRIILTF